MLGIISVSPNRSPCFYPHGFTVFSQHSIKRKPPKTLVRPCHYTDQNPVVAPHLTGSELNSLNGLQVPRNLSDLILYSRAGFPLAVPSAQNTIHQDIHLADSSSPAYFCLVIHPI